MRKYLIFSPLACILIALIAGGIAFHIDHSKPGEYLPGTPDMKGFDRVVYYNPHSVTSSLGFALPWAVLGLVGGFLLMLVVAAASYIPAAWRAVWRVLLKDLTKPRQVQDKYHNN